MLRPVAIREIRMGENGQSTSKRKCGGGETVWEREADV